MNSIEALSHKRTFANQEQNVQQKRRKITSLDVTLFDRLENEYLMAEKTGDIPKMLAALRKTVELVGEFFK